MSLILASNSPRRRQLLAVGGWSFHIRSTQVNETILPGEIAEDYVVRMAETKARATASALPEHSDDIVLAADTTVVDGNQILGKPEDAADAARMLRQLRGRTHQVFTGLAVLRLAGGSLLTGLCRTDVVMRPYSDQEVEAYIASGDPLDKAGAYAIQHAGFHPVEAIAGCYANVVGLPLCKLARLLEQFGIPAPEGLPQACQSELTVACPIPERLQEEEASNIL